MQRTPQIIETLITPSELWNLCCRTSAGIGVGNCQSVARLLFGTACQESNIRYRRQIGFGPDSLIGAFSMWQLERFSVLDSMRLLTQSPLLRTRSIQFLNFEKCYIWANFITEHDKQVKQVDVDFMMRTLTLADNDAVGALLCRLHYVRIREAIPSQIEEQANYWKVNYNTYQGAGKTSEYLKNYEYFSHGVLGAEIQH